MQLEATIAEKIHELVKTHAPSLQPKTWYGMQAYCNAEGKTVVFFQDSGKFKTRYCTLGFQDAAQLDEGSMWPTSYAVNEITPAIEKQITELIKRAVS